MPEPTVIVLDTNVALDLIVFADPSTAPLRAGLAAGTLRWIATDAMRAEFSRVLAYPALKLAAPAQTAARVEFDRLHQRVPAPAIPCKLPQCRDPDDQMFLDLAVAAGAAVLYSRDRAVLDLAPRLRRQPGESLRTLRIMKPASSG